MVPKILLAKSALILSSALLLAAPSPPAADAAPLRVLIVGGGPDLPHNQVAIESNVRYVHRLLPANAQARVLFTNGDPNAENVQYLGDDEKLHYRKPNLPRLDGPAALSELQTQMDDLGGSSRPVLLYFTGHGSPIPESRFENNVYDLWDPDELSVRSLAAMLKKLDRRTPVTVVMVQCFSGAFSNLLFERGDPDGALSDLNLCGFFAAVPTRESAGCTPGLNEAEYKDFTGYLFAALTGTDRLGRPVTGADYDKNGKVGMNEAFCYSLVNDQSIDTPVCTSDTFLRRFVKTPDQEVFKTPYSSALKWANPAQAAALEGLSKYLKMDGDDRLQRAYDQLSKARADSDNPYDVHNYRFVRLAKSVVLARQLMTTGDSGTKARYQELIKRESENPLRS